MKLSILQKKLKEGLSVTEKVALKSPALPILSNVLLEAKNNLLKMSATDLEIGVNWCSLAKVEKEGKIVVPVHLFANFVNFLQPTSVYMEAKEQSLLVESDKIKTRIKGQKPEDFPIIPGIEKQEKVSLPVFSFCQGLAQIVNIASFSTVRPEISGIYLCFQKNLLKMVATDSFRLGEKKLFFEKPFSLSREYSVVLPQKAVSYLISVIGDKEAMLDVYFSSNLLMFESLMEETEHPKIQFVSKLIEGEYPKYEEIIPKTYKTEITLDREKFLNQIKAAGIFAGRINEVKMKFEPEKQEVEIFCENPELGSHQSILPAKIKGEKTEISFNYKFLLDGLLNMKSREFIFLLSKEKEGEEGPGILKPVDDESYLYVVMPIQAS